MNPAAALRRPCRGACGVTLVRVRHDAIVEEQAPVRKGNRKPIRTDHMQFRSHAIPLRHMALTAAWGCLSDGGTSASAHLFTILTYLQSKPCSTGPVTFVAFSPLQYESWWLKSPLACSQRGDQPDDGGLSAVTFMFG